MSRNKSLAEHLKGSGTEKTASNGSVPGAQATDDLMNKLAAFSSEINGMSKEAADGQPGEGSVQENNRAVAEPSKEVENVTDAVINPQVELGSPGAVEEAKAGDQPQPVAAVEPVVSHGMGKVTDGKNLGTTPESVELAKQPTSKSKTASDYSNDPAGFARAFNEELEKIAEEKEATEAAVFLKEAGILEGYDFPMDKTASAQSDEEIVNAALQKIAKKDPITNAEIIKVADFYGAALEKEAQATADANLELQAKEQLEKEAAEQQAETEAQFNKLSGNEDVMKAVSVFQEHGLLPKEN